MINGIKTKFEFLAQDNNCQIMWVNTDKDKSAELYCDISDDNKKALMILLGNGSLKRGSEIVTICSKGKIKRYGRRVVTHILNILPPKQTDIEDFC